jgi:hypothetical protein
MRHAQCLLTGPAPLWCAWLVDRAEPDLFEFDRVAYFATRGVNTAIAALGLVLSLMVGTPGLTSWLDEALCVVPTKL